MPTRLHCDRCDALVDVHDAQAITVDHEGRYVLWTQGRDAYYAGLAHFTAPFLRYLCQACSRVVFADTERPREGGSE
jgi:hypothetical protein